MFGKANEKDLRREPAPEIPEQVGDINDLEKYTTTEDAVFGAIVEGGPNYRALGWIGTAVLMMKTQIGLGVLSIPVVFTSLGLIPGIICLLAIAIITTWSDYMIGTFKLKHPEVYGIDDVGSLIFGRIGRYVLSIAFILYWVFVAGSGMLGISIAFNALSSHGTCTAVFVAIAAMLGFLLASIRTLSKISWLAWIGLFCILASIFTLTVAVGVQDRPASAPRNGPWSSDWQVTSSPTPATAMSGLATLVFAYAGTPAFFAIVSEMKAPKHYTRSLLVCQTVVTVTYLVIGIVVYYYCGTDVATPALGSAGALVKKICYGIALPGLVVTTTIVVHIPAKYLFVKILRGSRHLNSNSPTHWGVWLGCTAGIAVVAYIIASAIPVFGDLVSLIGALLGTLMSFQPMGCMWLYDNWGREKSQRNLKWQLMVAFSVFVIVSGTFLMIAGTYGSVVAIMVSYNKSGGSAAWTCSDNSG
ncbi:amino acid transporter [Lecanosticta acicola]|uniref:Amino acid transporter n=1 Tax=Lecanosticta acicola TaxID=111012 RepID=A0AAI8W270_9PEZI|nr:amino acid transporter [Lecanosticta acicola]